MEINIFSANCFHHHELAILSSNFTVDLVEAMTTSM